jgi:hypothetical protein
MKKRAGEVKKEEGVCLCEKEKRKDITVLCPGLKPECPK